MRRFYFNMIEIILAIAIISIGISGVMGLFTSGLQVGKNTENSSYVPDVSETVIASLRSEIVKTWTESGWNSVASIAANYSDTAWGISTLDNFQTDTAANKNKPLIKGSNPGEYLYRQLNKVSGENISSFSAIVEVRLIDAGIENIIIPDPKDTNAKLLLDAGSSYNSMDSAGFDAWGKCRRVFEVRISYPAELPPDKREAVKIYRLEMYNDKYNLFACEKPE